MGVGMCGYSYKSMYTFGRVGLKDGGRKLGKFLLVGVRVSEEATSK